MADLAKEIGRHLPYLRRYARAITGEQAAGDRAVKATLERLLTERGPELEENPRLALYRGLHDVLRGGPEAGGAAEPGEHLLANSGILAYRIEHLAPAVREILGQADVPVIFVTAFPERLLTGERPEPAFLITKPFDPDTLHVSISQALAMAGTPRPRPAGVRE